MTRFSSALRLSRSASSVYLRVSSVYLSRSSWWSSSASRPSAIGIVAAAAAPDSGQLRRQHGGLGSILEDDHGAQRVPLVEQRHRRHRRVALAAVGQLVGERFGPERRALAEGGADLLHHAVAEAAQVQRPEQLADGLVFGDPEQPLRRQV